MTEARRPYTFATSKITNLPYQWVLGLIAVVAANFALMIKFEVLQGLVGLFVTIVALVAMVLRRRSGPGFLELDGAHLNIDTKGHVRQLDKSTLMAGFRTSASSFLLREKDGTQHSFTLGAEHPPAAVDEILGALGLDVGQRAITVELRPMVGPMLSAVLLLIPLSIVGVWVTASLAELLVSSSGPYTASVVFVWGIVLLGAASGGRRLGSPELTVGDDGLRIRDALGTRLIRYESLLRVSAVPKPPLYPNGVALTGKDLRPYTLAMYGQSMEQITGIVFRITESIAAVDRKRTDVAGSLARGSRSIAEWRAWLRTAATASGGFRDATLPIESLEALLVDPSASAEQRIGAAIALRGAGALGPANVQNRIRVAAEASANPPVRVALLAAAEDEIDEAALTKRSDEEALVMDTERADERWQEQVLR